MEKKTEDKAVKQTAMKRVSYGTVKPETSQAGVNVPLPAGGSVHFKRGETKELGADFAVKLVKGNPNFKLED